MVTRTFDVEEIHCDACENAIRKALTRLDGVRDVAPESTNNRVSVDYDESVTDERAIAERLSLAGYPVVS